MSQQPKFRLPPDLWAILPEQAQELIMTMQGHIEELETHVRELEARRGQNPQNFSWPPSADSTSF